MEIQRPSGQIEVANRPLGMGLGHAYMLAERDASPLHDGVENSPDDAVLCRRFQAGFLAKDRDVLLAFYGFPAEHWKHSRTTSPIECTFATVRLVVSRSVV